MAIWRSLAGGAVRLFVLGFAVACGSQPDESCVHSFYADADGDGHGVPNATATGCIAPPGYETTHDDCNDLNSAIHPAADELCNGFDDNCDSVADFDAVDRLTSYLDRDGDGYGDDSTSMRSCAVPYDRMLVGGDCDDGDAAIRPGAEEICNETDDDCDGDVDDDPIDIPWYVDADGDGYGGAGPGTTGCDVPPSAVLVGGDCDDHDENVRPDANERCNEIDDDCDTLIDADDPVLIGERTYYSDADGDGYGDDTTEAFGCPDPGSAHDGGDCDDASPAIHPSADDACDAVDNDCDGIDGDASSGVSVTYYADADADGFGDASLAFVWSCAEPLGYTTTNGTDCADDDPEIQPDAIEWCDGIDNDCSGTIDDHTRHTDWYVDADGDGYGNADEESVFGCEPLEGYTIATGDCDDGDAAKSPGVLELCGNSVDDDCTGAIDDCAIALDDADFTMLGPSTSGFSSWGFDVLAADLNADGIADLLAGAPDLDPSLYVAFGPGSGELRVSDMDLSFSAGSADSGLGDALAASDVDGDGDDDLLLGVPGEHGAYLFFGPITSGGDLSLADASFLGPSDEPVGLVAEIVPDHDGEGASDVVVSAMAPSSTQGKVYVATAAAAGTIDLETEATYSYEGSGGDDEFGAGVAAIGDTDGDGIGDVAIGAPGSGSNAVFVFAGGEPSGAYIGADACSRIASLLAEGFGQSIDATDFDGDGYADLFVGAPRLAPSVYGFLGPFADERDTDDAPVHWMGEEGLGFSVAAGGDVDADGEPDVLLGADSMVTPHGGAFLQLGAAEGTIDVADLPSFQRSADTVAGHAVTFVPDWTGDGGSEVAIGAPFMSDPLSPTTGRGRVQVVFSESLY